MKRRRQSSPKAGEGMQVIRPQVAGVDVGSREHWVSGPPHADGSPHVRAFGTTTPELEGSVDWLVDLGVESVAMESTGVYWIPLYEMLEARGIEVVLVNVRQLHGVPARKSDVRDFAWPLPNSETSGQPQQVTLSVTWPDGSQSGPISVTSDQHMVIVQSAKGN